jgi:hypothetical protein
MRQILKDNKIIIDQEADSQKILKRVLNTQKKSLKKNLKTIEEIKMEIQDEEIRAKISELQESLTGLTGIV